MMTVFYVGQPRTYASNEGCLPGISVPFLHISQLLANKRAIFRPKDQLDVLELEKIKAERIKMGLDQPE